LKTEIERHSKSEDYIVKDKNGNDAKKNDFNSLFKYGDLQPKLARFFMDQADLKLQSCYYCSLDYINAFRDFPFYSDGLKFVNDADKYDLQFIKEIDEAEAIKIIKGRGKMGYSDLTKVPISRKILNRLKKFNTDKTHNHFTLDHLFPQNTHPYYSLCLYNLVPSCYSCNSKFKNSIEFDIGPDLVYVSPTSGSYSFNENFKFDILFAKKFDQIKRIDDFDIKKNIKKYNDHINKYLRMFKIMGRYTAHKDEILELIKRKQKYPDSQIKSFSLSTGLPQKEIRKILFGEDLFDSKYNGKPLVKFRRDIANNIKIKGVIA
jgi:hypothetical protein